MFKKITENVEIHQTLPDVPNLTSEELKREWDKGSKIIKEAFNELIDNLNNNLYPIGFRIFINSDIDYTNHLGFVWKKVAKGRVLVGKDEEQEEFSALGKIGGEKTHKLTIDELAKHNHTVVGSFQGTSGIKAIPQMVHAGYDWTDSQKEDNAYTGGNKPHNNLQPYEVVNIWERIS